MRSIQTTIITCALFLLSIALLQAQEGEKKFRYEDFQTPEYCGTSCHVEFYQQWQQAMMSQAYTHHWDEVEYFKLAVPHADKDEKVAAVKHECNGCHAPISFLVGDTPPPLPELNSRANESVSCEVCHSITGFEGDTPFNFNYIMEPGNKKFSGRKTDAESPDHEIVATELHKSGDFCGICHNEKSPYGAWVKSTHLEWKEGPYAKEGVQCHDCHMPKTKFSTAEMGAEYDDARMHLFHGAHDPGKVRGTIELRINPDIDEAEPGEAVKFTIHLFNQKTGHKFPSGSVEDRIVWLHVEAVDAAGNKYHLPVDKKGFEGEEYTISADVLAYQDMGIALDLPDFEGVQRDGVPFGDRIFRMPYFDPQGRMTIQQWNTKSFGVDYRIGPRETKTETFTFNIPETITPGKLIVNAVLNYQKLIAPVAEFLGAPDEAEIMFVNNHSTEIEIVD
jgi:cytochrome c554/c'-like protein/NapC/NirT cytochrome c family protein